MIQAFTCLLLGFISGMALVMSIQWQLMGWKPSNWALTVACFAWMVSVFILAGMLGAAR